MGVLQKKFGTRVQQLRKAGGLTQEQLGRRTGMDGKVVGEIERGERNPTLETVEKIMKGLGVEPFEPFMFSFRESRTRERVGDDMLLNLVRHTDPSARPFVIELVQTALRWAQQKRR